MKQKCDKIHQAFDEETGYLVEYTWKSTELCFLSSPHHSPDRIDKGSSEEPARITAVSLNNVLQVSVHVGPCE